jgi:type I restriction enzyme S subunit
MIPIEWEASVLGDLVREDRPIVYGILMPGSGFTGGVPVIKVKDIRDGRIDTASLLLTDPKIDEAYSRSRVKAGDLLFTIRGTVGRMAIVPHELEDANITQDSARVSLSNCNPTFIARWLEMETPSRFVSIHTLGVAVRGINLRDVRRIPTPLVPKQEQDRIVDVISKIEMRINDEAKTLHKLEHIRSGLLSALLGGHIRVSPGLEVGAAQ